MKKWVGWVLLALSLYVTYEGWRNSRPTPQTEELSKATACQGREGCKVEGEQPSTIHTSFLGRNYTWKTSAGPVEVACARTYVFQGTWVCSATPPT
jgi:hypothetical protein